LEGGQIGENIESELDEIREVHLLVYKATGRFNEVLAYDNCSIIEEKRNISNGPK
jgi:hypothetical protein